MNDPLLANGWVTTGATLGLIASTIWAAINHFRVDRQNDRRQSADLIDKAHNELQDAHDKLVKTMTDRIVTLEKDITAWKARYDGQSEEFKCYRDNSHGHLNDASAKILKLTDENAQLRAKTDLTPVLKFQEEQSQINGKVITALDKLLEKMNH